MQYINNVLDNCLKHCSRETFYRLASWSVTKQLIESYRQGKEKAKRRLAAICVQGFSSSGTRRADKMQPTGLFMMDFDHLTRLSLTPDDVNEKFLAVAESLGIKQYAAWKTASGDGYRLITIGRKGSTIADDQKWIGDAMGIEYDAVVKDISRLCFVPSTDDIYHIDDDMLFGDIRSEIYNGNENEDEDENGNEDEDGNENENENEDENENENGTQPPATVLSASPLSSSEILGLQSTQNSNLKTQTPTYPVFYEDGVSYQSVVEQLIEELGGVPNIGSRNTTLFELARHLRYITDSKEDWIYSIVPKFGLSDEEVRRTIKSAVSKTITVAYTKRLQTAIKNARKAAGIDKEETTDFSKVANTPPCMPDKLPSLISHAIKNVPEHIRPATAFGVMPAFATHINKCYFKDVNNEYYEPSMLCLLVAPSSSGKSSVDRPIEVILERIKKKDDEYIAAEQQYMEEAAIQSAVKNKKQRPFAQVRVMVNDITNATFCRRLRDAENKRKDEFGKWLSDDYFIFSKLDELEEFFGYSGGTNYYNLFKLIKKAYDCGHFGQDRSMPGSIVYYGKLRWNVTANTTPTMARKILKSGLADGTVSRFQYCTIVPSKERVAFKYGAYDDEYRNILNHYIDNLERTHGYKECEQIIALQDKAREMIDDVKEIEGNSPWVQLAWRSAQMAAKTLYILWAANGEQWEESFEDYFNWVFQYDMWCKFAIHGENAKEAFGDDAFNNVEIKKKLIDYMPDEFTREQAYAIFEKMQCKTSKTTLLSIWKQRGQIEQLADGTYLKTKI